MFIFLVPASSDAPPGEDGAQCAVADSIESVVCGRDNGLSVAINSCQALIVAKFGSSSILRRACLVIAIL